MNKNKSLFNALEFYTDLFEDQPAFYVDSTITWRDFYKEVTSCLQLLRCQMKPSSHIAIHFGNAMDIAVLVAALHCGHSLVLIPEYFAEEKVKQFAHTCKCNYTIISGKISAVQENNSSNVHNLKNSIGILTSGTMGKPKCVLHTWESLICNVKIRKRFEKHRWFCGYPISHFAGLQVFLQSFLNGGCLCLSHQKSLNEMIMKVGKIHYVNCTPSFIRNLALDKTMNINHITLGGEVVDQQLIDQLKNKLPDTKISHVYASTELGNIVCVTDEKAGFSKKYIDEKNLKIIDNELYVHTSTKTMKGYMLERNVQNTWIPTKDIVCVTENRVYFAGRKDNVFNVGGNKVHPYVIEETIRKLNFVKDVVVTAHSSSLVGNLVSVTVSLCKNINEQQAKKQICDFCQQSLPSYMQPRIINIVTEVTRTFSQKVKRR